jgi:hypothetical protein
MANVIRLNNGGVIQVRTGVLQGIGPIGPRGLTGPQGAQGEIGPQGETGPMGGITEYSSKATISAGISVSPDTDTLVSFGNVSYDDLAAVWSSTNFTLTDAGDYQISVWVRFDSPANAGDGVRALWLQSSVQGILVRNHIVAVADEPTYAQLVWADRYAAGEQVNVYARQGDDLAVGITAGAISICRIGAGLRGAVGPAGPAGPVGPAGPQGPEGPAGSATSGFTTYADLLP